MAQNLSGVVRQASTLSLVWGVLLICLGVLAVGSPMVAAVAVNVFVAWLIVMAGVVHLIVAFHTREAGSVIWRLLVGLAYICFGGYLIARPALGVASLTLVLASLFLVEGIFNIVMYFKVRKIDIGMAGNGAIAALVAITAPSGYVELWAAPIIGAVAGVIVVFGVIAIDKWIDDPVGALSAHGLAGIWGTISCGLFTSPRLAEYNAVGDGGLWYTGSFHQLIAQIIGVLAAFTFVFTFSFITFFAIKKTIGMRVSAEEEDAGLDISEHGMYGYPEQFIPAPELIGYSAPSPLRTPTPQAATQSTREVPA